MTVLAGVRKRYRTRGPWVLDGIDLELPPGVLVRVLGGNGTGKSTLLRLAAGIGRPTRGRVTGRPVTGYVPERFPPALPLTAQEYLLHLGRIHGLDTRQALQRALDLLDRFEAAEFAGTPMQELSKGTAQKVAVAQALLPRPGLLVLDEAWTGLDAHAHALLDAEVDARLADAGAVLFVDHDPDRLADRPARCFALDDGRLVPVAGPPAGPGVSAGPDVSAGPGVSGVSAGPGVVEPPSVPGGAAVLVSAGRPVPVAELELSGLPAADPAGIAALLGVPGTGGEPDHVRSAGNPHGPHPLPSGRWWLRVPVPTVDDVLRRALAAGPEVHVHRVQEATPDDRGDQPPPDFGDDSGDRPALDSGDRPAVAAGDRPGVPPGDGVPA